MAEAKERRSAERRSGRDRRADERRDRFMTAPRHARHERRSNLRRRDYRRSLVNRRRGTHARGSWSSLRTFTNLPPAFLV